MGISIEANIREDHLMADEDSALQIILRELRFLGVNDKTLEDEIAKLWQAEQVPPDIDEIGIRLRDNKAFQDRFPANKILADQGKQQYTVSQYLTIEADYKRTLQQRGMPPGFYDQPSDFQNFIAQDVSPDELGARIDQGYQAVRNAPANVVAEFQRLYGVSEGDLAAYFIDPTRARPTFDRYEAERQARSAAISAQAQQQAQIQLQTQEAEALARAGVTPEQAQAGFTDIAESQGLFAGQMQGEQAVSREEQIGATFGTNAAARKAIAERRRRRTAQFEAGGGFAGQGQASATGLTTIGQ